MGETPQLLAQQLRDGLGLVRGVETGTYKGGGARLLAGIFDEVVSIELSAELAASAAEELRNEPSIEIVNADSRTVLPPLVERQVPTFWYLDGHWSGGPTAGAGDECPVLDEIRALAPAHPDDCIVIDDARLFLAAPPSPHDPAQWPTIVSVFDALRDARPGTHITLGHDQVLCVPMHAKALVDEHVRARPAEQPRLRKLAGRLRLGR